MKKIKFPTTDDILCFGYGKNSKICRLIILKDVLEAIKKNLPKEQNVKYPMELLNEERIYGRNEVIREVNKILSDKKIYDILG